MMLSGFCVDLNNVVPILWPFKWLSTTNYTFSIITRNEFTDNNKINIRDTEGEKVSLDNLMSNVGIELELWSAFVGLIAVYLLFIGIAMVGLVLMTKRV